jgi:hypothetical protein
MDEGNPKCCGRQRVGDSELIDKNCDWVSEEFIDVTKPIVYIGVSQTVVRGGP